MIDVSAEQKREAKEYYLRDDIVEAMVRIAEEREFATTFDYGYGSRPDAVNFPGDYKRLVENGAVAFHGSVERWKNPFLIGESEPEDIRTGWDLVIDIDADAGMEYAKIAAKKTLERLADYGIQHRSVKFSGNRGFHLGIRHECFPDRISGKDLAAWYPELPQAIIDMLRDELREELIEAFLAVDPDIKAEMVDENRDELNPYLVADLENNWGDRHLFRLPYSINEKSWLVSVPITEDQIMEFEKERDAQIEDVTTDVGFLDSHADGEATELAIEALDWRAQNRSTDENDHASFDGEYTVPEEAIEEEYFPPTIKNILDGLADGRKRGLFVLITFLAQCGYGWDAIEGMIWEWNQRNDEPLGKSYITTQLNWHQDQSEPLMPPNFEAKGFYKDMQVYEEDRLTQNVKNPVSYAKMKAGDDEETTDEDTGSDSKTSEKELIECPYCGKEYKGETKWYRDHVRQCGT